MFKEFLVIGGLILAAIGVAEYNTIKNRELEEKKVENQKIYYEKLTSPQVEQLEREKLDIRRKELEVRRAEAESKEKVLGFKNQIQSEVETKTMNSIKSDMRDTFDKWSAKFETRLDNKIDNVVERIDNLSDKYGGVKAAGATAPSINVVNAPNNQ